MTANSSRSNWPGRAKPLALATGFSFTTSKGRNGRSRNNVMSQSRICPETLRIFCTACFEKLGLAPDDARVTADSLLFANLRGVDSHGVIRLKIYADRLRAGGFRVNARPQIVTEQASSAVIDAGHGVGQVAA